MGVFLSGWDIGFFDNPNKEIEDFSTSLEAGLKKQLSQIQIENEQAKLNLALEKKAIEESNFWSELIDKVSHPETIDYSFLKKYGIIFLIFFLALWYFSRRRK